MTAVSQPLELARHIAGVGTIQFLESDKRREYWLLPEGGERRRRMPSVTSILRATWPKPELFQWYAREGANVKSVLAAASERGRNVHLFVETFMATGELMPFESFPAEHAGYLQGVARFLWERDPRPRAVERLVVYPELNYAGRLDLIADIDGVPTLLDFKTNPKGRIYPEAHIQVHAYALADERCGEPRVGQTMIVGVGEDGEYVAQIGADASKIWGSVLDFYKTQARFAKELEKVGAS